MFKFRIYVYIIPCNQCDDFQHPLPYSASTFTSTFNTHSPIQHPLPLSIPTSLFSIHFHLQHPLPYSASTSIFNTHFPILHPLPLPLSLSTPSSLFCIHFHLQHPLPLLHSIATNSMCCNLLSQLRSASFHALSSSPLAIFL